MEDIKNTTYKKVVSYSQYSKYISCAHKFYWDHVMGKRVYEENLNTCFGTAIHKVLQLYVKTLYTEGIVIADSMDLEVLFKNEFL
jgi:hypothetical protein